MPTNEMTTATLRELVKDFVVFLSALDKVVPSRVDEELISFLTSLDHSPWLYDLLLSALNLVKRVEEKGNAKIR